MQFRCLHQDPSEQRSDVVRTEMEGGDSIHFIGNGANNDTNSVNQSQPSNYISEIS
jgi:hypothetical protein